MKKFFAIALFLCLMPSILNSATFVVTNTLDAASPPANSLRFQINAANTAGGGTITFDIPGTGVRTITPVSTLPSLTSSLVIDGTTQPGYSGTPLIQISGTFASFLITGGGSTITGLAINGGASVAVEIQSSNNIIENCFMGTDPTGTVQVLSNGGVGIVFGSGNTIQNNIISGSLANPGITLLPVNQAISNTLVQNNLIGTDITGSLAFPNAEGIQFTFGLTPISQTTIINNLISGNTGAAINVQAGLTLSDTLIQNNLIGVNKSDTNVLPNGIGISIGVDTSGSLTNLSIQDNVISGNTAQGIVLNASGAGPTGVFIQRNHIGTDRTNTLGLGNLSDGIQLNASPAAATNVRIGVLGPNFIAFNGGNGVTVNGATLNSILANPDFDNTGSGIVLTNNGNDNQATPSITSTLQCLSDNNLYLMLSAPTTPAASTFRLEVFDNEFNRNPITEGQTPIGAANGVASGATQNLKIPGSFLGTFISATATNMNGAGGTIGDTSEFSDNFAVSSSEDLMISISPSPQTLCPAQPKTLTTTISNGIGSTFNLLWTPDGVMESGGSPLTRSVSVLGDYTVTVTDGMTFCTGMASVSVVPEITVTLAPLTQSVCMGMKADLMATVSGGMPPYTAILNDGTPSSGNSPLTFIVTPTMSPQNYQVNSLSDSASPACSIFFPSNPVTVNTITLASTISANPTTICPPNTTSTVTVTVTGGTGPYTVMLSNGQTQTSPSPIAFTVTPPVGGMTYSVSSVTDTITGCVLTNPPGSVIIAPDQLSVILSANHSLICDGQSVTLSAAVTGNGPFTVVFTENMTPVGTVTSSTSPVTLTVTPNFTANYRATVTDASGCTLTSTPITVTVSHVGPIELVTNKNTIIVGQSATLTAFFEGTRTLFWSDGTVNENVTSPFKHKVRPKVTTTFTVTDENADGCKSTSNPVTITVKPIAVHLDPVKKCPCPDECVTIFGTIKAGTPPFRLSWSDGKTFKIHSRKIRREFCARKTTSLTVTVTDGHHDSATSNKIKVKRCKAR